MQKRKFILLLIIGLVYSNIYAQAPATPSNRDIVETFLNGFNHPDQLPASLALLADDYQFQNPMVKLHSKADFLVLAREIGKVVTGLEVIRIAQDGDWVAVFYEFKSSIPGLATNRATEWFRVEEGKIRASHLIYDASEWRKVYAQMKE